MTETIALLSAGAKISWAAAASGAERPTTGYAKIPQVVSLPEFSSTPNMIDVTRLSATQYTEKIAGLVDAGDTITVTLNLTQEAVTAWEAIVAAAKDKLVYFAVEIVGIEKAYYFQGSPQALGSPALEPNQPVKINANIGLEKPLGWLAVPTAG